MSDSKKWLLGLSILCLAACGGNTDPEGVEVRDDAIASSEIEQAELSQPEENLDELQNVQIPDAAGFGQPMVAATAQIPVGWSTRGGVSWDRNSQCVSNHLRLGWLAASATGRHALEIMPGYNWQVQGTDIEMNPCPPVGIRSAREFLQTIAQRYPAARAMHYRDRPDLVQPQQASGPANVRVEAGELLIAYHDGSKTVTELLIASLTLSELQGNVVVGVPAVYAYRTTDREIDPLFLDRFIQSLKVDSQWMANVQQTSQALVARIAEEQRRNIAVWHQGEMAKINARGAADRANIRAQANREVAQIYSNTWANSQATDDRIQRRTLETIGEYNTYTDPSSGGVVRESTHYDRVIRTQNGSYISTNDPYLNPAGSQELERLR
jgi:hypothetical protein